MQTAEGLTGIVLERSARYNGSTFHVSALALRLTVIDMYASCTWLHGAAG